MLDYRGKIGAAVQPDCDRAMGIGEFQSSRFEPTSNAEKKIPCGFRLASRQPRTKFFPHSGVATSLRLGLSRHLKSSRGTRDLRKARESHCCFAQLPPRARTTILMRPRPHSNLSVEPLHEGGVLFVDDFQDVWIEEYIVNPPTHILNGFIWALWGVYDYSLTFPTSQARDLFNRCVETLNEKSCTLRQWLLVAIRAVWNQTTDGSESLLSSTPYRAAASHGPTHQLPVFARNR